MDIDGIKKVLKESRERQDGILSVKGTDYTVSNDDRLFNFKQVAEFSGQTPLTVWFIYTMKHLFALANYVKTGKVESEGIEGRFDDLHNYLTLGEALIKEEE